jgi:hypothetical protein
MDGKQPGSRVDRSRVCSSDIGRMMPRSHADFPCVLTFVTDDSGIFLWIAMSFFSISHELQVFSRIAIFCFFNFC